MGLHVVALAKLSLLSPSHTVSPLVTCLICPFVLKLSFGLRSFRRAYTDVLHASRLFFFQLSQTAFDTGAATGNSTRWERALRLAYQSVSHARRSPAGTQRDEDSFHALSMFSL